MQIYDGADVVWINFEPIAHAHGVSQHSVVDDRMLIVNAIYPHIRALYAPEPGIDQEITVPELVKEDTLCPHQDFVYVCSPTAEESERLKRFEETEWDYIHHLIVDPDFQKFVADSKVLKGDISSDI